jgi:hypothetical protein
MQKNINKYLGIALLLFLAFSLSACLKKSAPAVDMSQVASDGKFHYQNPNLGFSVDFPSVFEYYQVQRVSFENYTESQFFVPTADRNYPQQIKGYGRFLVVRIYDKNYWETLKTKQYEEAVFENLGEHDGRYYLVSYWKMEPSDWSGKWNMDVQREITGSFKFGLKD